MNDPAASSPALGSSAGESWLPGPKPPEEGWSRKKFLVILGFVFAAHVALIFLFGTRKQITARPVTATPHLQLVGSDNILISLGDPTLFARPNVHDVVSDFWRRVPPAVQPNFDWTEPPRFLAPAAKDLGVVFRDFVRNSQPPQFAADTKPKPTLIVAPVPAFFNAPQPTSMQITGALSQRRLLDNIELPSLPYNDVIQPSVVQAVVDPHGNVSAVLMTSSGNNDADQLGVQLTRNLHFGPAPNVTFGQVIFNWHTVPTNSVPPNAP